MFKLQTNRPKLYQNMGIIGCRIPTKTIPTFTCLWVMSHPILFWKFFGCMMWSGIILHQLICLCLLGNGYWGRKCGNRWRQPRLSKISWWFFGLKTYLFILLTVQLQDFWFSPALCRKFQCHSWECRAGSIKIFMYFPKEILWCKASFPFSSWNTSLTSRTDPSQRGLSLAGCLRICCHWTKSPLFSWPWAMWTLDPRNSGWARCRCRCWFTFPVLHLQFFDELLLGGNVKGSLPMWEQSWNLFVRFLLCFVHF